MTSDDAVVAVLKALNELWCERHNARELPDKILRELPGQSTTDAD